MRHSLLLFILSALPGICLHAQDAQVASRNTQNTQLDKLDPDDIVADALNRRIIKRHDTMYFFYAVKPIKPIKTAGQKWYYWYGHDTVLRTAGAYEGRVLDGEYKVLYPGGNIKESGNFKLGLKSGVWKTWYPDGTLQSVDHWKDGDRKGPIEQYDAAGKPLHDDPLRPEDAPGHDGTSGRHRHAAHAQSDSTKVN